MKFVKRTSLILASFILLCITILTFDLSAQIIDAQSGLHAATVVSRRNAPVRDRPSVAGERINTASRGKTLIIVGVTPDKDWYLLADGGWVHKRHLNEQPDGGVKIVTPTSTNTPIPTSTRTPTSTPIPSRTPHPTPTSVPTATLASSPLGSPAQVVDVIDGDTITVLVQFGVHTTAVNKALLLEWQRLKN